MSFSPFDALALALIGYGLWKKWDERWGEEDKIEPIITPPPKKTLDDYELCSEKHLVYPGKMWFVEKEDS